MESGTYVIANYPTCFKRETSYLLCPPEYIEMLLLPVQTKKIVVSHIMFCAVDIDRHF